MSEDVAPTAVPEVADGLELTPEQQAALVLDRNVSITAGAGTGKTTTLTNRYLALLQSDPDLTPENIVTITFTRKAAAELQTEVREKVYDHLATVDSPAEFDRWRTVLDELEDGYIHTIHAFCTRLLRENAIQAPVPMAFDVLDEDDAMDLQRQVVSEYIDANRADDDVALLSKLFGSHGRLIDVLSGLLDARPESEHWLDEWGDRTAADYLAFLWNHVCELQPATARDFLTTAEIDAALETARRFTDEEYDPLATVDGVSVLRDIADIIDGVDTADGRQCQLACQQLYSRLQTSSGGLYASASHHLIGTKGSWNGESDAYSECKNALNTLLEHLSEMEAELETTPGECARNSTHYVFALARTFEAVLSAYAAEKERREALDFHDLIATTVRFLEEHPEVRGRLRDSFDALMVDEFQDTDDSQWTLLTLLAELHTDEEPTDTLFLVGDKKQSIYGFRGADVTTFETARRDLQTENGRIGRDTIPISEAQSPTALELSGNFRTLQTPLTFLNELFESVFEPEGTSHQPYEAPPQRLSFERDRVEDVTGRDGSVEYLVVPEDEADAAQLLGADHPVTEAAADHTTAAEAEALAARLSTLLHDPPQVTDPDTSEVRSATPEDVAILLRRRTHLDRYQRALDAYEIPYSVVSGVGFYDSSEVQTLINLLRVLADPTDDISLYGVLRSPLFGLSDDRLARFGTADEHLWKALAATEDPVLSDARDMLTRWRELAGCVPAEETDIVPWNQVLTQVIDDTGYLISIGADERGQQAVANVEKFRDEIRQWSEDGMRTAASLLRRIDRQADLDPREGEAEIPDGTEGVRIMTIHAAKGLEFPIVTVPDLGSDLNFGRSIDDYGYIRLLTAHDHAPFLAVGGPDSADAFSVEKTIAHAYGDAIERPRERAEAKRLLYVACTRVRDHLLLCGTHEFAETDDELIFKDVPDADEVAAWRDWLQPLLLEREDVCKNLLQQGRAEISIGESPYLVQLPGQAVDWKGDSKTEQQESDFPRLELPALAEQEQQCRVSATQIADAASEYDDSDDLDAETAVTELTKGNRANRDFDLPRNDFGTIVHRVLELDRPRGEWPSLVRQIAGVNDFNITDETVAEIIEHAADACSFLDEEIARYDDAEVYEEVSVSVDVNDLRIVGDIDHLLVTPDSFVITDYKTNRLSGRTSAELASHYRPQMMCYAVALLQHDQNRRIRVNLRFTEGSITETFEWDDTDRNSLETELVDIGASIER